MISREHRKAIHRFLLQPKRNPPDLLDDAIALQSILKDYGCTVSPWEHPILFQSGIHIHTAGSLLNLIPTKRGYRLLSYELDGLQKTLSEIICQVR